MNFDLQDLVTLLIAVFGAVTGLAAIYGSFRKANIDEADLMTRLADKYGDRLKDALDRIATLETEYDDAKSRITFLERALTVAHKKIDHLMKAIKDLINQLVDAGIKPAHTLDGLEELEDKEN